MLVLSTLPSWLEHSSCFSCSHVALQERGHSKIVVVIYSICFVLACYLHKTAQTTIPTKMCQQISQIADIDRVLHLNNLSKA